MEPIFDLFESTCTKAAKTLEKYTIEKDITFAALCLAGQNPAANSLCHLFKRGGQKKSRNFMAEFREIRLFPRQFQQNETIRGLGFHSEPILFGD